MTKEARVAGIARKSKPFAPMEELERAVVTEADGVEGDCRGGGEEGRRVAVLFEAQWREACEELGVDLPWTARRANLLVRGMDNPRSEGARLAVGSAVLEVAGECAPCSRMELASPGLREALGRDWRGGAVCRVRRGGAVALGDPATLDRFPLEEGLAPEAREVLLFWFVESTPAQWFRKDAEFDRTVKRRFGALRASALSGEHDDWAETPQGALALTIALDQFSRNLFREDGRAFEADSKALALVRRAVEREFDQRLTRRQRMFLYLPFMHAEDPECQDACVRLYRSLDLGKESVHHADQHREVIRRFGRFPHRNAMLGRTSTPEEEAFLREGGYTP